ncbi:MBL fold metallo-hydrolase [Oceanobacillus rekensis]|uniref:MBL fold metallo-hydrolase n=1 Tax=Oceanobacillus rekensis TaxID=937927 RepID=UPI000B42F7A5|nr:MBL fold metallo-hydrolase [Oceanobacillus rekensis]
MNNFITQLTVPTPFEVGDVHVYLLKGDMLTLVDAGVKTDEARESVIAQLSELGYKPIDIEQIILTHHHPDHTGLIEEFPRMQHLTAHENVASWLTRNKSFKNENEQFFDAFYYQTGIPENSHYAFSKLMDTFQFAGSGSLTAKIQEGDMLPGHPEFKVIETKGHAQTHLSFFREKDGLFIGGDHLIKHISPNPMIEAPMNEAEDRPKPMLDYRNSLKKCLGLGITNVFPGHGEIFSDAADLINKRLISQEKRANKVYHLLREKASTPFELCMKLFPKHYEKQLNLTISETVGQLDYLFDMGMVDYSMENGIMVYDAK